MEEKRNKYRQHVLHAPQHALVSRRQLLAVVHQKKGDQLDVTTHTDTHLLAALVGHVVDVDALQLARATPQ